MSQKPDPKPENDPLLTDILAPPLVDAPADPAPAPAPPMPAGEHVIEVGHDETMRLLLAAVQQASQGGQQQETVKQIVDGLAKLGAGGVKALAETPAFQAILDQMAEQQALAADARPGSYIVVRQGDRTRRVKRGWSRADIEREYPKVTQTAWKTTEVRPHGVHPPYLMIAGETQTLPSIVWDIARQSDEEAKRSQRWADEWFGTPDKASPLNGYFGFVDRGSGYKPSPDDVTPAQIAGAEVPKPEAAAV